MKTKIIKTKTAFIIFTLLTIIIFPYYIAILTINSDFLNSIIPGWHTNIIPARIISNLFKFLTLIVVSFFYWKFSKITAEINFKLIAIHLALTIPAVLLAKVNLYEFVNMNLYNAERQIQIITVSNIFTNILFFLGQILFWIFYVRMKQKLNLTT